MVRRRIAQLKVSSLLLTLLALVTTLVASPQTVVIAAPGSPTYTNPLPVNIPGGGMVESCADPSVIRGQKPGDRYWYMYCTTDPLNDSDKTGSNFNFHIIPMLKSLDLVNWTYVGDAFTTRPSYATGNAGLWAPEIKYYPETGKYNLYYTVTDTTLPGGGSAIGVATSSSPTGPWTHSPAPVIEPHAADCCPGSRRWVYDPEVLRTDGPDYIYYGSYFGGISVRQLSEDGLTSNPATQQNVAIANKYEGAEVALKGGYYYLSVSATDCCRGPLTGYSVFAGRSKSPTGPFLDRTGVDLNDNEGPDDADVSNGRAGGTPVISMNGNRWVGPGHNTVFEDAAGQWWTVYHAIDQSDPYFEGAVGFTKRPALLDPIDWVNGWPTVRGGFWASDSPQPAPAAQPGQKGGYNRTLAAPDQLGSLLTSYSDEFDTSMSSNWSWVRQPADGSYGLEDNGFRFNTQAADLHVDSNNASVLTQPAPAGDYVVETKVKLNLPDEGCCFNYVQAGLVAYGDDNNFVKLVHVSIWNTRQTEFAREVAPVPAGFPRYGNTVVGPPDEWTYLRIVKRTVGEQEHYRAYTSRDGETWERGGVWTHKLGAAAKIGLVSMGGGGFIANFDYVRVYQLQN